MITLTADAQLHCTLSYWLYPLTLSVFLPQPITIFIHFHKLCFCIWWLDRQLCSCSSPVPLSGSLLPVYCTGLRGVWNVCRTYCSSHCSVHPHFHHPYSCGEVTISISPPHTTLLLLSSLSFHLSVAPSFPAVFSYPILWVISLPLPSFICKASSAR